MKRTRWMTGPALATAAALALAACSASAADPTPAPEEQVSDQPEPEAADHNVADAEFAQMMIIHHEGAIEMAELIIEKASTEEVRALGERIAAAQGPEIELMSGWLDQWGEAQPDEVDMGGMGHEGMEMDGMDQDTVMAELSGLTGIKVDRRFLELMIEHHQGAIEMAETLRTEGLSPDATELAGKIIDDQMAEITEMTNLLRTL